MDENVKLRQVLQELQEDEGLSDEAIARIEEAAVPKFFREAEKRLKADAAEAAELRKWKAQQERTPKVLEAFKEAGLDLEQIEDQPLLKQAVVNFEDFEDAEKVAEFIEANRLPTRESKEPEAGDSGAQKVVGQGLHAARSGAGARTKIGPEDAAEWDAEVFARFEEADPQAAEQVLRGETVATTFSP